MFFCLSKYQAKRDGNDNSGQSHTSINFMVIDVEYFVCKKKIAILKKKKIIFKRGKIVHTYFNICLVQVKFKYFYKCCSIYDWYHPDQTEDSAKRFLEEYPYEPLDQSALFLVHPYGEEIYKDDVKYVISCK